MANQYNISDVFLSYSRKNIQFARELFERLEADGKTVWVDWDDIPMTADWWREIEAGIEAASSFVFVISPDSIASRVCYDEIEHAERSNKRIIPVLYADVTQEQQDEDMHDAIKIHNWVMAKQEDDFEAGYAKLLKAIELDLQHVNMHSRILVRARDWVNNNYDRALLLRGTDLTAAQEWLDDNMDDDPPPTEDHILYIAASQRDTRVRRTVTTVGFAVVIAMTALALFALFQFISANDARNEAEDARTAAELARDEAEQSRDEAEDARDLAITASIEAEEARDLAVAAQEETRSITLANDAREQLAAGDSSTATILALMANDTSNPPVDAQQVIRRIDSYSQPRFLKFNSALQGEPAGECPQGRDPRCLLTQRIQLGFATLTLTPTTLTITYGRPEPRGLPPDVTQLIQTANFSGVGDLLSLAYSEETAEIVVGTDNGFVIYYDLSTSRIRHVFGTGANLPIDTVVFDGVTGNVFARNAVGMLFEIDLTPQAVVGRGEDHIGAVHRVAFDPQDETRIRSVGMDGQILDWANRLISQPETVREVVDFTVLHTHLADPAQWVLVTDSGQILVYDTADTLLNVTLKDAPLAATVNRTRNEVAIGLFSGEVIVVDLASGTTVWQGTAHDRPITALAYDASGERLATASQIGEVALWDAVTGAAITALEGGHNETVNALAFHSQQPTLVSAADDGTLVVWDLEADTIQLRLSDQDSDIKVLQFVPPDHLDGLLSGAVNGTVALWDTETWEILQTFPAHDSTVLALDVSSDGSHFVSGSNDQSVILWRLETTEGVIARIREERTIPELTCAQRDAFSVEPLCDPPAAPIVEIEPCTATLLLASGLNVRGGPGTGNETTNRLRFLEKVPVLEMVTDETGGSIPWLRVGLNDTGSAESEGFARFDLFGLDGDCTDVIDEQYVGLAAAPVPEFAWIRGYDPSGEYGIVTNGWRLAGERGEAIYAADGGYVIAVEFCNRCGIEGQSVVEAGLQLSDSRVFSDPGWNYGYGHYTVVRYLNGQLTPVARLNLAKEGRKGHHVYCLYAHMHTMEVSPDDVTSTTTRIGTLGVSGNAQAPSLYLECRATDELITAETFPGWQVLREGLVDPGTIYSRSLRD